jgi:hypothetical protein
MYCKKPCWNPSISKLDNCGAELNILGVSVPDKRINEHVDGVGASKCSVRMCGGLRKKKG